MDTFVDLFNKATRNAPGQSDAAQRWVNQANAEDDVDGNRGYLLVTETDTAQAKGSWSALCAIGTGG